jgi:hypothetical protein
MDADDEHDNVLHTGLAFSRVDAFAALEVCAKEIVRNALPAGRIDGAGSPREQPGCAIQMDRTDGSRGATARTRRDGQ